MKILVTGGAGYIGSMLVPMLLNKGHAVTVYDTFYWGATPLFSVAGNSKLKLIKGDITDRDHVTAIMKDKDAIVHLAAIVGIPACDKTPELALDTNIVGTKNIADETTSKQILVYASTGSCYGSVAGICTESTNLEPISIYGKSKAQGEEYVRAAGGIALRLATLFGLSRRMRLDLLINDLTFNALHIKNIELFELRFRRTFLHVKDAAHAFIFALEYAEEMKGQAYNVGNETLNMTKLQVVETIKSLVPDCSITATNSSSDKDKRDYEVSYSKINKLGYQHSLSVKDGIKEMMQVLPLIPFGEREKYINSSFI